MRKKAWIYLVILILMISITGCGSGGDGEEKEPEKVVTPVISPKGGTFLNEASVTITTETDGAVIRYTTDESEPGADSKIYDSAITITATTIIKAKAFKDGMTESDTVTETFTIEKEALEKIEITKQPTKTSYYVGDTTLDITGLEVTGTYNNGSSKKETVSLSNITGFETTTSGEKTLTITVSGKTATFKVTVVDVILTGITVTKQPTKTSYYVGSTTLDITGLEVTGTYNNGSSKKETVSLSNITGFDTTILGEKTLTITLSGKTATFKVMVLDVILTGITVTKQPTKTSYYVGSTTLDITGLEVTGTYNNGSSKKETVSLSNITGFDTTTSGEKTLKVTLSGKTATFKVMVLDVILTGITVTKQPTKTSYYVGSTTLDITGLEVTGTYNNGSSKKETVSLSNITGFETTTSGEKTLTITVSGKTATFKVTVVDVILTGITVTKQPTKTSYYVGSATLDITGLEVTGTYNNGSSKLETVSLSNITGFETTTSGEKTLTITVSGKTATFKVTVVDVILTGITVTKQPTKTSYYVGSTTLDITGLEVTGTYNNGSSKKETVSLSNITGFDTTTSGEKTLKVTLSGKTATFKIMVVDVITKAEFTLKRKVDVLELNEYSALFEVTDSSVTELKFLGTNSIAPLSVKIADKKGILSSIKVGQEVTEITIKAVDINGNQIGNTKKVAINN